MATSNEKNLDQRQRLHEMREHLRLRTSIDDPSFAEDVVATCVRQVQPIVDAHADLTGEEINAAIAKHLGVRFEEVRTADDIDRLEQKYLVEKREIGFAQLADELADRTVDALLFERIHATLDAPDRWVAILNVQETGARAYWSRPHEILHRLAEPPQKRLKFFRHRTESEDRLERIIDLGAAELAFPRSAYGARVVKAAKYDLTWDLVRLVRQQFAPTSSLLSAAKAFVRFWPHPVFLLTASLNKSRSQPNKQPALRIRIGGFSATTERAQVHFIHNMRVPPSSPMSLAFASGSEQFGYENLATWTTSSGTALPNRRVLTAAAPLGSVVYGLVSLE